MFNRTIPTCLIAFMLGCSSFTEAGEVGFSDDDKAYWAFQPLRQQSSPRVLDSVWSQSPIDPFVLAKLEAAGLVPAKPASRRVLLRRAYFGLTGLPPSAEEVVAFERDSDPRAFEKVVDRLLASPRHGEHWSRHWLDLVRYADSNGYKSDEYRPHAWRYRDYVVDAFNADKPYKQFITEQLAGDEAIPDSPEALIATGYLRHWPYESNQRDLGKHWADIINEITDVTGEVFMGLSMGCARCHDHKFDPILQKDYYRLRAFFAALDPDDSLVAATRRAKEVREQELAKWLEATRALRAEIEEIEKPALAKAEESAVEKFDSRYQQLLATPVQDLSPYDQQIKDMAYRLLLVEHQNMSNKIAEGKKERWEELRRQLSTFDHLKPLPLPAVMAVRDIGGVAPATTIPGSETNEDIAPGFLTILHPEPARVEPPATSGESTGRRLALAKWLTSTGNPLTARVVVNRIWQYHFGRGLVATPSDFGHQGEEPSHPELLDWLARRFIEDGWSFKKMHRLILTSATYQQTAVRETPEIARGADPNDQLLWRAQVRRLQAEQIRDATLAASGELDLTMHGEGANLKSTRRSVFLKVIRNEPEAIADVFDGADGFNSTAHRDVTTTPSQALLLMNGNWTVQRAQALAHRVEMLGGDSTATRIETAYRLAFGRSPSDEELRGAEEFIRQSVAETPQSGAAEAQGAALFDLCHMLLNSNEFLYLE